MENAMSLLEEFQAFTRIMANPNQDALAKSMDDVHHPGVFSLVIAGTENGQLIRVFVADKKIKPFAVQLHTHRYRLKLTVLKGEVKHHVAEFATPYRLRQDCVTMPKQAVGLDKYKYRSPLNGGTGLEYAGYEMVGLSEYAMPVGSRVFMNTTDAHTVSCSKGSMWLVEEQGFVEDHSYVWGVPFVLEGLYKKPAQYQVNDMFQRVLLHLRKLVQA